MTVQWWVMDRQEDVTGISGTGVIGYVIEVDNGVILLWDTHEDWETVEWLPDMSIAILIHGHEGKTVFNQVDAASEAALTGRRLMFRRFPDLLYTIGDLWQGVR